MLPHAPRSGKQHVLFLQSLRGLLPDCYPGTIAAEPRLAWRAIPTCGRQHAVPMAKPAQQERMIPLRRPIKDGRV